VHNSRDGNRRIGRTKRKIEIIKIHSCLDALFFGRAKCIHVTRDKVRQRVVHNEYSVSIKSKAFLELLKDN